MPNNFKAISLKKNKASDGVENSHKSKVKNEDVFDSSSANVEVKNEKKAEEQPVQRAVQMFSTVPQSKDSEDYSKFSLGKKMKDMDENSRQKFSNLKRQEEENRMIREDQINKKIASIRQKMEKRVKLAEERKKAKLELMRKVAEQKLREMAMRERAERDAICKKEVLDAIEKLAISTGSWFEVAKMLYKAGIL